MEESIGVQEEDDQALLFIIQRKQLTKGHSNMFVTLKTFYDTCIFFNFSSHETIHVSLFLKLPAE